MVFRQIEGYHFRSQSGEEGPAKRYVQESARYPVSSSSSRRADCSVLSSPSSPGNARRQPLRLPACRGTRIFHQQQFSFFRHGFTITDSSAGINPAHVFPPLFRSSRKFPPAETGMFPWLFHLFHDAATLGFGLMLSTCHLRLLLHLPGQFRSIPGRLISAA